MPTYFGNSILGLGRQAVRLRKYNVLLEMECGGCGVPPFPFDREGKGGSVCDDNEYRCRMSGDLHRQIIATTRMCMNSTCLIRERGLLRKRVL